MLLRRFRRQIQRSGFNSLTSTSLRALSTLNDLSIPTQANVVIVGGGIIGSSIAYHLSKAGIKDVVLLEKNSLTSGTTWHAAGLMVTYGSLSETSTEIRKYTKHLYNTLEAETGQSTGFKPVGFVEIATDKDRLEEYRRIATFNRKCGVDVQEISPKEIQSLFPLCKVDDIEAGFYVKDDGRVNPVDATMAFAKGARLYGAKIIENVSVSGVTSEPAINRFEDRQVTGVTLTGGHTIRTPVVVNAMGMWARQFGEACGVNIPNQAAEHYYLITDSIKDVDPMWPVIEDPSSYTYIRPEAGGLMVGLFEPLAAAWNVNRIPEEFAFGEIEPDWSRMGPFVEKAMSRVPASMTVGVKKFFCGPESFAPDLAPIVGESPEMKNYFVAAGLNSIGIISAGGIGKIMSELIMNKGICEWDITGMNIDRLHSFHNTPEYRGSRVTEALGMVYKTHYPYYTKKTARGSKRSPFYQSFLERGAYFKDVSGWEGADWFYPKDVTETQEMKDSIGKSWTRQFWFDYWAKEHKACREGVVLIDMSFMSKFLVQGKDAGTCLNRLSTANVNGEKGLITYTQWLNEDGKMEADITISKLTDEKFMIVVTDTMHRHVETWAKRNLDPTGEKHVFIQDVTGGYSQLNIQGPLSRDLMQLLTDTDMSNDAFPFRTVKEISIGLAKVICTRITYVGELGYELFIPTEHALHVYEYIVSKGERLNLVHAGLKALGSLRLEKGYKDYGHDMDNTDSLLEVGLGFTADYKKEGGFIGKEALQRQKVQMSKEKDNGLKTRLCSILVSDPNPFMYHGEVIFKDGICVGDVRVGSYGHTLGGAVGLAMITANSKTSKDSIPVVNKNFLTEGKWEVEIAGKRYPCQLSLNPFYDPQNKRIK